MTPLPPFLLLDLDDTILDDTGARDLCWRSVCVEAAERDDSLDAELLRCEIESVRNWFWSDAARHHEWRMKMQDAWVQIVSDALERMGIDNPALATWIGVRHHELRDAAICPLPEAVETLARLRERGVTLGLITNGGSEGQRAKIERFDLAASFAYIGIEGEVGHGKPHRIAYETALRSLGVGAHECWMVGDNLEWDVAGAQAVGIRGIWVDQNRRGVPSGSMVTPDRVVSSISELVA